MSIDNLPDNKLLSLALQGYHPFQPDVGIFNGGYQGILYPNPTTLSYPGFDPYAFTEPTASVYTPGAHYNGLGIGDPGIDYKNPGHILGLLDTFGRMSYGIAVWKAIHAGDDIGAGVAPAIDINVPLSSFDDGNIGLSDIYPAYSEVPSAWINGFSVSSNGTVTPDPRPSVNFPPIGGGHTPITSPINELALTTLFAEKSVLSYIGMPQYFRSVIDGLVDEASILSSKSTIEFHFENPMHFNRYAHQISFFEEPGFFDRSEDFGQAFVECQTQSSENALITLNGSVGYHDGAEGQNEYRSLTELNSVINIIPIQMVGAIYWSKIEIPRVLGSQHVFDEFHQHIFRVASYTIVDFMINVTDIPKDSTHGEITIDGDVVVHSIISDPTAYYRQEIYRESPILTVDDTGVWNESPGPIYQVDYGSPQGVKKSINIEMSMTNKFSWDKNWIGLEEVNDSDSHSDIFTDSIEEGGFISTDPDVMDPGISTIDQNDLSLNFNKTFTLGGGCNSIRMRVFVKNRQLIGTMPRVVRFQTYVEDTCSEDFIFVPLPIPHFELREVCHFPGGILSYGFTGDPDSVPDNLNFPNIELSFTVNGTNIDPIVCEISV